MHAPDSNYREVVEVAFREAAFLVDLGIRLVDCGPGWVESSLPLEPRHRQHTGLVHAGVQATIADHTAGTADILLGGLEYQVNSAIEIAGLCEITRGPEERRRVPVMTTGMHLAGRAAGIRKPCRLGHRQGIHVGAQSDRTPRGAVA